MGLQVSKAGMLLVFAEGETLCALPSIDVQEVVFLPALSQPPGMPSVLEGIMTLDGVAVPVLRAAKLLGLSAAPDGVYTPAMILKDARAALTVERMVDIFRPNPAEIVPAQENHSFNGCLAGVARMKDQEVHILSVEKLLLQEERRRIDEFQALVQKRLNEKDAAGG